MEMTNWVCEQCNRPAKWTGQGCPHCGCYWYRRNDKKEAVMNEVQLQILQTLVDELHHPANWEMPLACAHTQTYLEQALEAEQATITELNALTQLDDKKDAHKAADKIIAEFLRQRGYAQLADRYDELRKNWWYG